MRRAVCGFSLCNAVRRRLQPDLSRQRRVFARLQRRLHTDLRGHRLQCELHGRRLQRHVYEWGDMLHLRVLRRLLGGVPHRGDLRDG